MSSAQDDTFSPHNLGVLGGLLLIALILGEVIFERHGEPGAMADPVDTDKDIAMRLKSVVTLDDLRNNMTMASSAADDANKTPSQLYQGACFACHGTGVAGAPKLGDASAWSTRISKGLEALTSSAINGIGIMAPKGGSKYSDDQLRSVVEYMVAESQ